jgi:hypothetical protein
MRNNKSFADTLNRYFPDIVKTEKGTEIAALTGISVITLIYFLSDGAGVFFYQENRSLFIFSAEYLSGFVSKPGGLLEYAGNFLTQFYYSRLAGSVINTTIIALFFMIFLRIMKKLSPGSFPVILSYIPVCLLFFISARYTHSIHNSLGFIFITLYFLVYHSSRRQPGRFTILALFPFVYYIVGSYALLFLPLVIIYCLVSRDKTCLFSDLLVIAVTAAGTYLVFKDLLFFQTSRQLLMYPLPFIRLSKMPLLYLLLCGYIIILPLLAGSAGLIKLSHRTELYLNMAAVPVFLAATVVFIIKQFDPDIDTFFRIERFVYGRDWDNVIRLQEKSGSKNSNCQYYYNLALSEKGLLCSRMFYGPQNYGIKSLSLPRDPEHLNRAVYFYYCIGLISEAHHLAYESMVINGYRPENIKMLIKTELINGNYKIAERYINVLKKTLFYKKWAIKFGRLPDNPELINSDPELGDRIKSIPKKDFFIQQNDFQNIENILADNPANKKAFEYKLAGMLLEKNIKGISKETAKFSVMGYTSVPRHIEEAVAIYINIAREFPDLGGLQISRETENNYKLYLATGNRFSGNRENLEKEIRKACGNTYWYYYQFR